MAQINILNTSGSDVTIPANGNVAIFSSGSLGDEGLFLKESNGNIIEVGSGGGGGSGTSGSSGSSGTSGVGTDGSSGSSGTSGADGSSGSSGTSGIAGAAGSSGSSGTSGADGSSGSSGTSGADGSSGSSGTSGIDGSSGSSGTSGDSGSSGSSGTSGVGTDGSSGSSGTSGIDGSSGSSGTSGVDGSSGSSGTSGIDGSSGSSGTSGDSGSSGSSGTSGVGTDGSSGSSGTSGIDGSSGSSGTSGINGSSGSSGTSGTSGTNGSSGSSGTSGVGIDGSSGSSGTSGVDGSSGSSGTSGINGSSGSSGTSGAGGSSGSSGTSGQGVPAGGATDQVLSKVDGTDYNTAWVDQSGGGGTPYNNVVRYNGTSSSDAWQIMSSGNIISSLTWSRTTTTLSITSTAHGLTTGDYVVIRNMSVDYSYLTISNVTTNAFDVIVPDSGGTSGTAGVYVPALDVSTLNETTITVEAPTAGNVQLLSMRVYINSSETGTFTLSLPTALDNGAGQNTALNALNPPLFRAYDVGGTNSSLIGGGSVSWVTASGYGTYTLDGSLDTFGAVILLFQF